MATIFLTTTAKAVSYAPRALEDWKSIINLPKYDTHKQHHVVDSPAVADIILFVGDRRVYHSGIYSSPIFKKYPEKSLVIDFRDQTIPRIPGIYATIPSRLQQYPIYEYLFYPYDHGCLELDKALSSFTGYKYLFSFMGNIVTYPAVRGGILELIHPRAYLQNSWKGASVDLFSDVLIASKFVLCPRGISPSTIRVFEAMRAGRVPVIISDEWQPPLVTGNWQDFSIIIPEKDIRSIPTILEKLEPKALEMGRNARLIWAKNFSNECGFHWIVEACLRIQHSRSDHQMISSRIIHLETFSRSHFLPFWKEVIRQKLGLA